MRTARETAAHNLRYVRRFEPDRSPLWQSIEALSRLSWSIAYDVVNEMPPTPADLEAWRLLARFSDYLGDMVRRQLAEFDRG